MLRIAALVIAAAVIASCVYSGASNVIDNATARHAAALAEV